MQTRPTGMSWNWKGYSLRLYPRHLHAPSVKELIGGHLMFLHEVPTDGDEDVLVEQSLPEYPGTHEQTPLLLQVPRPE